MSQRDSGYARKERDCYETPEWVTEALLPHIPGRVELVWEPACGSGKMASVLGRPEVAFKVAHSDIESGCDFLSLPDLGVPYADAIITNPPYNLATEFIEQALRLTDEKSGFVAMLLRTDFDHAKGRKVLFADAGPFAKKLVLRQRIRWIEGSTGSPSFNHAWFMWDWKHEGPPTLAYH